MHEDIGRVATYNRGRVMMGDPYYTVLAVLVGGSIAIRFVPSRRRGRLSADPSAVAFLRGGARAAAQTTLVELHELGRSRPPATDE
ncbi:hypothetical protein GXW82_30430 [Streptacidiphilus sp. 4-A2]|nr:hypothetical protein [Streptacidiphilus sp. 4-A2]